MSIAGGGGTFIPQIENENKADRFSAIEGLRAWLAWGVFFGHIVLFAGLRRLPIPQRTGEIASDCVEIFIIISGFVISHLILTRNEAYLPYITRRFFRLFPAFTVCAVAGGLALAISQTPWPADHAYEYGGQLVGLRAAQSQHFTAHFLLHLTMLHGLVPNNILNFSQWAFLPPAWSLSLEWQFYLVAPAALLLVRRPLGAAAVSVVTVVSYSLYVHGHLGIFALPSTLPGAGYLFLLGIASRLCCDKIRPSAPVAVAIATFGVGYVLDQIAIGCWLAFFTYMFCSRSELEGVDRRFVETLDTLFASRMAKMAGERTYCVYLVHFPIFQLLLTAVAIAGVKSPITVAGVLLLFGLPLTVLISEGVHRYIELPGMRVGRELARQVGAIKVPSIFGGSIPA